MRERERGREREREREWCVAIQIVQLFLLGEK